MKSDALHTKLDLSFTIKSENAAGLVSSIYLCYTSLRNGWRAVHRDESLQDHV